MEKIIKKQTEKIVDTTLEAYREIEKSKEENVANKLSK